MVKVFDPTLQWHSHEQWFCLYLSRNHCCIWLLAHCRAFTIGPPAVVVKSALTLTALTLAA